MKRAVAVLLFGVLLLTAMPIAAQDEGATPAPKIIQIIRESIKPGRNAAHEVFEAKWPAAFNAHKSDTYYTAISSITGPNEVWYISGYPSFEAWEKTVKAEQSNAALSAELSRLQAGDAEFVDGLRTIAARFREDLSHRPPINIGSYRNMSITIVRVRPGTQSKWADMRKKIKAAHEQAGMKDYYSVFEVLSGVQGPAFMIIIPMKSMKDMDEAPMLHTSAAYVEALGGAEGQAKMEEVASASIMSNENMVFAFSPKMSRPPASYFARTEDKDFWTPKAMMAAKPKKDTKTVAKE